MNKPHPLRIAVQLTIAFFLILFTMLSAFSQVKIGDNPTVINPSAILETESTTKGFLKPRLTTAQRTAIVSPATGLEVYDTDTQSNWYYNGTVWVNGASTNIYNADGTLTGTRTVTQGANTLSFTGSAVNAFSVDGSTFSVDAANNAIGLGTAAPNTNAVIDATAVNKGILFPRVALTATNLPAPLSAFVAGMTVYNTATASSGATAVTPGLYYTDGTKWVRTGDDYAADPTVGSISAFPFSAIPTGYLECNGAAVSRTTYADLFAKIGTSYGAGDGSTTFNVPDLRGEFIRGWDNGRGVDASRALGSSQSGSTRLPAVPFSGTAASAGDHTHSVDPPATASSTDAGHTHTIDPPNTGTSTNGAHSHALSFNNDDFNGGGGGNTSLEDDGGATYNRATTTDGNHTHTVDISAFTSASSGSHSHTIDIAPVASALAGAHIHTVTVNGGGDAETRPRNVAMVYAIKAVDNVIVPTYATTAISAAAAANEPWFKVGTATGASSNTDDVYINGNVGIRTSTPVVSLDARGSIHFDDAGTATANVQGGYLAWNRAGLGGAFGNGNLAFLNHQGLGNGGFVFTTTNDNTTFNERMRITGDGNVGIGTTTPASLLTIVNDNTGDNTKDNIQVRGYAPSTSGNSPLLALFASQGTLASPSNLATNQGLGQLHFGGRWNAADNLLGGSSIQAFYRGSGTTSLTDLQFLTSNTTRMTINENGNVGIGTNTPSTTLDVNGSARIRSIPTASNANQEVLSVDASGNIQKTASTKITGQGVNLNQTFAVPLGSLISGQFRNNFCNDGTLGAFTGLCILNFDGTFTSLHTDGAVTVVGNNTGTIRFRYINGCAGSAEHFIQFSFSGGNITVTSDNTANTPTAIYIIR